MEKTKKSMIDFNYELKNYDESNPLVLPSKRAKDDENKKRKRTQELQEKTLSKKKRRELERKLAQKEKKLTRGELWEELEVLNKQAGSEPKLPDLSLFKRSKKVIKPLTGEHKCVKGKLWKLSTTELSDSSTCTDDYSTDDDDNESSVQPTAESSNPELESDQAHVSAVPDQPKEAEKPTEPEAEPSQPARFVLVTRQPDVVAARLLLPIIADEASIMEAISQQDCVVICGETGCGKTTQVPQFLYEAGYARDGFMIGITEPRRVAAISMSKRVGVELNLPPSQVSYHIRFEKTVAKETQIKFMTDGVLLQEIKQDFELSRYSVIVVDEAHERSIYTDVLLGLISMVLRLRRSRHTEGRPTRGRILPPLKLIIMSATLRVADFADNPRLFPPSNLLGPPPVIRVESRQFPVTNHFARVTEPDYLKAAFRKVIKLHQTVPLNGGGILVFLTGQREVSTLCSWLNRAYARTRPVTPAIGSGESSSKGQPRRQVLPEAEAATLEEGTKATVVDDEEEEEDADVEIEPEMVSHINLDNFDIIPLDEETELGKVRKPSVPQKEKERQQRLKESNGEEELAAEMENSDLDEVDDDDEVSREIDASRRVTNVAPIHALPLYSLLSPERQQLVFNAPPDGCRLVVVATNVAETSLTIPNIRFVVDSGKVKTKVYDTVTGASTFEIVWISQASAEQRAGRAGRMAPGQCHRLYSSQVFSSMYPFSMPDILARPIDDVVLMLKSYLGSTPLSRFPLPTAPSATAIEAAECRLVTLGALEELHDSSGVDPVRTITRAGRWIARLPLPPRFGRMLLFANQQQLMPYAVILVAALSVPDLFTSSMFDDADEKEENSDDEDVGDDEEEEKKRKKSKKKTKGSSSGEDETSTLAQFRTNFVQQFVRRREDLQFGDLAVLLGTICCLERYAAQLNGIIPAEPGVLDVCGGTKNVKRDPDAALRFLVDRCGVRWNAYKEVRQLRHQLTDILNANVPDLDLAVDPVLPRPTPNQINQLRQLFLVGSPCHVAGKFDVPVEGLPARDRRRFRYAYKVPGVSGPVFIDPSSPLARENCSFVAFLELHRSGKPYLRKVCSVDPRWIPFLAPHNYRVDGVLLTDEQTSSTSGAVDLNNPKSTVVENTSEDEDEPAVKKSKPSDSPLTLPTPTYDEDQDCIVTGVKQVAYLSVWSANSHETGELELPNRVMRVPIHSPALARSIGAEEARMWSVRWFVRFLLEGKLLHTELGDWFPGKIRANLSPTLVTVSWGVVRQEVRKLIAVMLPHRTNSLRSLRAQWEKEPLYLSKELASWLRPESVSEFLNKWPLFVPLKKETDL